MQAFSNHSHQLSNQPVSQAPAGFLSTEETADSGQLVLPTEHDTQTQPATTAAQSSPAPDRAQAASIYGGIEPPAEPEAAGFWPSLQQKAPPPNPWAAAQSYKENTASNPTPPSAGYISSSMIPAPLPIQAPHPVPGASLQSGLNPDWSEHQPSENPAWPSQTGTAQPGSQQLSQFADNPGWQPSISARITTPAQPPIQPPVQPPVLKPPPVPQQPIAQPPNEESPVPTGHEKEQQPWEFSSTEAAAPPATAKPRGLNAFMPKGKKK